MKAIFRAASIRTRLLVVYMGIILLGFAGLTLIAGRQISSAAQADFAQRLQNEIILIAQGVSPSVDSYAAGQMDGGELDTTFAEYETQVDGELNLYTMPEPSSGPPPRNEFHDQPELETALRGQVVVVERRDEAGEETFYTAAPVFSDRRLVGLIQLRVPARSLQNAVTERWLELVFLFVLVAAAAVLAAFGLARSIIRPLYKLRESAVRLSTGDFSHRIAYTGKDEIGEVAHAFNEMAQQVESMLEEQRAFASNTSHELRTPLTTIGLRTEALRYDATLDQPTARQYIEEIDDEVARLGNLVQDLTLLSRFDAGRAELGQDQVDLLRFATSAEQHVSHQASEKNIRIALSLPDEPVVVNASINHLMVVFRNLLDNAIKYTPEGGVINWTIEKAGGGVCSIIRDPGRGVDTVDLPHLFERFYRADKARSRETPGTGLGLALVKSIVEAYGGRISIASDGVGKGTAVTVFWPYRPEPVGPV